jgi:hypothetical protein
MDEQDPLHIYWNDMLSRVRSYAQQHARRHFVLCDAHTHGEYVNYTSQLLFDSHAFPMRPKEVAGQPQQAIFELNYRDSIFGRSGGGVTPSGWSCT